MLLSHHPQQQNKITETSNKSKEQELEYYNLEQESRSWIQEFDAKSIGATLFDKNHSDTLDYPSLHKLFTHFDERLLSNLTLNTMEYSVFGLVSTCLNFKHANKQVFVILLKLVDILTSKHKKVLDSLLSSNSDSLKNVNFLKFLFIYETVLRDVYSSNTYGWEKDKDASSLLEQISQEFIAHKLNSKNNEGLETSQQETDLRKIISVALSLNEIFSAVFTANLSESSILEMIESLNRISAHILSSHHAHKFDWAFRTYLNISSRVLNLTSIILRQSSMSIVFTAMFVKKMIYLKENFLKLSQTPHFLLFKQRMDEQLVHMDDIIYQYLKNTNGGISKSLIDTDMNNYGLIVSNTLSFKCQFLKANIGDNVSYLFKTLVSISRENPSSLIHSMNLIYKAFEHEVNHNTFLTESTNLYIKTKQAFMFSIIWLIFLEYNKGNIQQEDFFSLLETLLRILHDFDIYKTASENSVPYKFLEGLVNRVFRNILIFELDSLTTSQVKQIMTCLRRVIITDYRIIEGYYSYIWKMVLKIQQRDIEAFHLSEFMGDMLSIFVHFAKGKQAFDDLFSAIDMIHQSFRNSIKSLVQNIAPTDIVIYFNYLIDLVNQRLDEYGEQEAKRLLVVLLFPLTSFGFYVTLNESNYKKLQKLAKQCCTKIVKRLMNLGMSEQNQAAVIQLYYSMSNIIYRSEEFSSDVFSMKDINNHNGEDYVINYYDGTGLTMNSFINGKPFKDVFQTLSFKNKGIYCYIIFRRMMSINQQVNIRKHNLITSNQELYSYETQESKTEQELLTQNFQIYFDFIQNELNSYMHLHKFKDEDFSHEEISSYDWGGFIESIDNEKKYLSMLCYMRNLSQFMLTQLINAIRIKGNSFKLLPYSLERVTLDLWKDDMLFEQRDVQDSFEEFLYNEVKKSIKYASTMLFGELKWAKKVKSIIKKATLEIDLSDCRKVEKKIHSLMKYVDSKIFQSSSEDSLDMNLFSSFQTQFTYSQTIQNWNEYLCPFINLIPLFPFKYFSSRFAMSMFCMLLCYDVIINCDIASSNTSKNFTDCTFPLFGSNRIKFIASLRHVQLLLLKTLPEENVREMIQIGSPLLLRYYIRTCSATSKTIANDYSELLNSYTAEVLRILFKSLLKGNSTMHEHDLSHSILSTLLHVDVLKNHDLTTKMLHVRFTNTLLSALFSQLRVIEPRSDESFDHEDEMNETCYALLFQNSLLGKTLNIYEFEHELVEYSTQNKRNISMEMFENVILFAKILLVTSHSSKGLPSSNLLNTQELMRNLYECMSCFLDSSQVATTLMHTSSLTELIELVTLYGPSLGEDSCSTTQCPIPPSSLFVKIVKFIQDHIASTLHKPLDDTVSSLHNKKIGTKSEGERILSMMVSSLSQPQIDFLIRLHLDQLNEFNQHYSMPTITVQNASHHQKQVQTNVAKLENIISSLHICLESIHKKELLFYLCNIIESLKFSTRSYLFNSVPVSNHSSLNKEYWQINASIQSMVVKLLKLVSFITNEMRTSQIEIPKSSIDVLISLVSDVAVSSSIFTYSSIDVASRGKNILELAKLSYSDLNVMKLDPNIVIILSEILETLVKHNILNVSKISCVQTLLNCIMNMMFVRVVVFDSLLESKDNQILSLSSCTQCAEAIGAVYHCISKLVSWDEFKAHIVFEFISTFSAINELVGFEDNNDDRSTTTKHHHHDGQQFISKLLASNKKKILDHLIKNGIFVLLSSNVVKFKISNWIQESSKIQTLQHLFTHILQYHATEMGF
ncbi:hypothetical protein C9374_002686 [Naegleria lovaniensis]|uniref:Uncharacterized protein n=1 Tax=Naegleria lovaniensis TaxID=51637 RepID=A0AA88GNX5_NAELO|nr:uncharacterized protein C9374_002686 [Naegleria lovaniensis]KAG2386240.1 hypothetical protein C9374_002686 [Naegleria lovaniensis]